MKMNLKTERSITAGQTYVPSKANLNPKNGLYEVRKYDTNIDPFAKNTTKPVDPVDPMRNRTPYSPVYKTTDIVNRKIEPYEGHSYDTYYDYAFPNDKSKEKTEPARKPKPKQEPVKPKKKETEKKVPVERAVSPFPYNATKSVSRTLLMMSKNKVNPTRTTVKFTQDFD